MVALIGKKVYKRLPLPDPELIEYCEKGHPPYGVSPVVKAIKVMIKYEKIKRLLNLWNA